MSKILEENTTIQNILKNYLKQENITVYKLSKDTKLTVKTIQNILENTNSSFRKKTLEKILVLKNLNTEDKKYIKYIVEKKEKKTNKNFLPILEKINNLIAENNNLKEKVKILSLKEDENYFLKRKVGAFNSDIQSNSLLITKIWDFNETILKEWADVKMLLDINNIDKTKKMKKGLKGIAENLREISNYLEDIYFDVDENEKVIILKNDEE